ncbi:MAG TPA: hypothetical protein DCE42_27755 [Myxococcales bacterium]|nr:hypothetical protein [Myxococcales bacterium]
MFSLPNRLLRDAISDHLTLNNYEIRCSHEENERQWLWVRHPELYLILKFKDMPEVELYQSFSEEKSLFTPWGYQSLLGDHLKLPQNESLLVLDLQGGSLQLDTTSWWMPNELITIEDLPAVHDVQPQKEDIRIPVHLRYQPAEQRETPRLWMLKGSDALPVIESLFFELGPEERSAIGLFIGDDPEGEGSLFFLRDDRPHHDSPLFSLGRATGFESFFPEEGLYIKTGYRIYPSLPPEIWRQEFQLDTRFYTLLEPNSDRTSAQILRIPQGGFAPLETFAHYRIGAQSAEVRKLGQSSAFDVLFSPQEILDTSNANAGANKVNKKPEAPTLRQDSQTTFSTSSIEQLYQGVAESGSRNPKLQQLESSMRQALKRGKPLTPHHWVSLASLYYKEFVEQKQNNWLQEAFKALDQVLYLDRHADEAVGLEVAILKETLQVEQRSFQEQMALLDQHVSEVKKHSFFARLSFRLRARLLLEADEEDERSMQLRLHFYRDLAAVEEHLMIREHHIYVAGVSQFLGDLELFERARLQYRQLLEDRNRLQGELPAVLVH